MHVRCCPKNFIARLLPARRVKALSEECEQLCRILGKSVSTAKANSRHSRKDLIYQ
jgi:hypothetical protein